jgi:hypothetical protein
MYRPVLCIYSARTKSTYPLLSVRSVVYGLVLSEINYCLACLSVSKGIYVCVPSLLCDINSYSLSYDMVSQRHFRRIPVRVLDQKDRCCFVP